MKVKIKVKDFNGKEKKLEKEVRAEDHFAAQRKFKSVKFENKTKRIPRKAKHKGLGD